MMKIFKTWQESQCESERFIFENRSVILHKIKHDFLQLNTSTYLQ